MVVVRSVMASDSSTPGALALLDAQLKADPISPHFVFAFYGHSHDDRELDEFVGKRFPGAAVIGGTSCAGVMSDHGLGSAASIGMILLEDAKGSYGAAARKPGDDPAAAAQAALNGAPEETQHTAILRPHAWLSHA